MKLIVAIHDVTPALDEGVRRAWALSRALGVTPALDVVPDWHGEWPLEAHPAFVSWIHERAREGAEIMLHGLRHDEVDLPRRLRHTLRAWGRTAREGEFLTLDLARARERVAEGRARLQRLGLEPVGFVPPAWLGGATARGAARAEGFAIAEDVHAVHLLQAGQRLPAPVCRWSARTQTRAIVSTAFAALRLQAQGDVPLARIAVHPPDMRSPWTYASVVAALRSWGRTAASCRYADLLDVSRGLPLSGLPSTGRSWLPA